MVKTIKTKNLVIGSGPGGATIANSLSRNNQEVIIIEEGKYFKKFSNSICDSFNNLWKNNGITPVFGDKNLVLGQGKCVGGGSTINAGLIWKTPEFILQQWKKNYNNSFFENFDYYYNEIKKKLDISEHSNLHKSNSHTEKILCGAKKLNWSYVPTPQYKNKLNIKKNTFGGSSNSLIYNYLKEFENNNGQLISNLRLEKIILNKNQIDRILCYDYIKKEFIEIKSDFFFLCCGSIQTPHILKKNNLIYQNLETKFHCNLRFLTIFDEKIKSNEESFASHEINEFQEDGLMIIPSDYSLKYISTAISSFSNSSIKKFLDYEEYGGLYVAQIRLKSKIKIKSLSFLKEPLLTNYLTNEDKELIRFSIDKIINLLFESGAKEVYLPFSDNNIIDYKNRNLNINKLNFNKINMISVHLMSSLPMFESSLVNDSGKFNALSNLFIADASILPDNIGQSPQGTIMLFANEIANRFLENYAK